MGVAMEDQLWDAPATSTPLADFRDVALLARGFSVPLPDHFLMNERAYHVFRRAMLPRWYRRVWPWLRAGIRG